MQHIPTILDHGFEYIGGDLSTDFVNTKSGRLGGPAHEHIERYADLVEFARQGRALTSAQGRRLIAEASDRPEKAAQIYRRGVTLREAIFRAFARLAVAKDPAPEDLEIIGAEAADAFAHARVMKVGAGFGWEWPQGDDLARPLWPIARAASELLTNDRDRELLRECRDDTCAWLFVDRTKNHTRRWCDMETCGNRAKQARLRQREKKLARTAR